MSIIPLTWMSGSMDATSRVTAVAAVYVSNVILLGSQAPGRVIMIPSPVTGFLFERKPTIPASNASFS